jgi:hypothetical protein
MKKVIAVSIFVAFLLLMVALAITEGIREWWEGEIE